MKLHQLTAPDNKRARRVGRGISAGQGKTAGKGTKGQKARSGYKMPRRFEGGQSSLIERLPKRRGFRSPRVKAPTVRIDLVLARVDGKITPKSLLEVGLLSGREAKSPVIKIVGTAKELRVVKWSSEIQFSASLAAKLTALKK